MNKQTLIVASSMLILGLGIGYWFATQHAQEHSSMASKPTQEKKALFYRNPMNPAITSPVAAKDNMGMDYIAVYADDHGNDSAAPAGTVRINATMVQNMGVRTTQAKSKTLSRTIRTVGRVTYDEERVARLHPKYDGWIEKMMIDKTGEPVHKGSMLMSIYSPQLVATQEEYLLALNNAETLKDSPFDDIRKGATSLLKSAHDRLQLLDVPEHQIKALEKTREVTKGLHIHSPFDGIVMNIGARDGQRITPETELYMIADLSRVWVIVDLYEDDLPWVREGDEAAMTVAGIPGRTFRGKVSFIYPYLEAKTRTVKMRLVFDNPELALKPDMFANVTVKAGKQINAIVVPSEAIVRTGEQTQVFVQRDTGKYEPRKVVLGIDSEGEAQIIKGLEAGETVVTSSQFLIDSESKLKEATAKMMETQQAEPAVKGMSMDNMEMPNETMPKYPKNEGADVSQQMDMKMNHMDMKAMDSMTMPNETMPKHPKSDGANTSQQMDMKHMDMKHMNMEGM